MNTATAIHSHSNKQRRKKQETGEPVQLVHDLKAAARHLASYIRAHAVPLNKMEVSKMSSMVQKLTGILSLGPVQHGGAVAVYESMRVGATYLKAVKVVGQLDTLLRNGENCTLWVATIRTPTPWLFKRNIYMVYAVEVDGVVHRSVEECRKDWNASRILSFFILFFAGIPTMFLGGIGLLFWINAVRLPFARLPLNEMRGVS